MKRFVWILAVALGASLTITGCGNKGRVSTSDLQSSFKSAEPAMQSQVDKAVTAVKSNNYPEALSDLQVLAHKARLTPDQQQVLKDTMAAIQDKISSTTNKPPEAPRKTVDPLQQLMRKQQ
jgi:predicted small lipoprotein YifL